VSSAPVVFAGVAVWRSLEGERRFLLRDVDWHVGAGEHWGVVGPNGAGKTTLLRIASAQLRPSRGSATVLGGRLGAVSMPELRRRIGFLEQGFARRFYPEQRVLDVVLSGVLGAVAPIDGWSGEDLVSARALLGLVGASGLTLRSFASCSEGERARILLARALIADAPLLALDEPAAGLDLEGREVLLEVLDDLMSERPGLTTLIVTHHIEELPASTTHLLLLREGAVVASGPIAETATEEALSECFGLPLAVDRSEGRLFVRAARR
jgi:iron complex transport system ATP-binding protein